MHFINANSAYCVKSFSCDVHETVSLRPVVTCDIILHPNDAGSL